MIVGGLVFTVLTLVAAGIAMMGLDGDGEGVGLWCVLTAVFQMTAITLLMLGDKSIADQSLLASEIQPPQRNVEVQRDCVE